MRSLTRLRRALRKLAVWLGIIRLIQDLRIRIANSDRLSAELEFYRQLIQPGQVVFDVGANRGQSSEVFLAAGAQVVAFEPQEALHREIRQMCRRNPRLTLHALGLGAAPESRELFLTSYDQTASFRENWEGEPTGTTTIEVSTLDEQIAAHRVPDYCKIDVEGWEVEVLRGLHQALPLISIEYHISPNETRRAIEALRRIAGLGSYFCNLREAEADGFLLARPIPIESFIEAFPEALDNALTRRYGEVFCATDSEMLESPKPSSSPRQHGGSRTTGRQSNAG